MDEKKDLVKKNSQHTTDEEIVLSSSDADDDTVKEMDKKEDLVSKNHNLQIKRTHYLITRGKSKNIVSSMKDAKNRNVMNEPHNTQSLVTGVSTSIDKTTITTM